MAPPLFSVHRESQKTDSLERSEVRELETERDLPPVVARMVVEIRSDGSRTIARGALEDLQNGERVALQANADSPVALAKELTKAIFMTPVLAGDLARQAMNDLLPEALKKGRMLGRSLGFGKKSRSDED